MRQTAATYRESVAFAAFKKVRNALRRYYPEEIIFECINRLNRDFDFDEYKRYPPWDSLLLIKWTIIWGDYHSPDRMRLESRDFDKLYHLMYNLNGVMRLPNQYENFSLYFRNLAFQQFWLQENLNIARFSRQSILFGHLEESHSFCKTFKSRLGITVKDFIYIAAILLIKFLTKKEPSVAPAFFKTVHNRFSPETIDQFFAATSLELPILKEILKEDKMGFRNISFEYYEQSPLRKYPLLKYQEAYFCYSKSLIFHAFQNFIYDTLRDADAHAFMDRFGEVFEKYVKNVLSYCGLEFMDEEEINRSLGSKGKTVDFLIVEQNINVLVDAKGVEIVGLGMVNHQTEIIQNKIKSSIIKGIEQGFETADRITGIEKLGACKVGQINYLLIVTYKDLYLGGGREFYENIAKQKLDKIKKKYDGKNLIPFENMYFLSIDDLELLAESIKRQDFTLIDYLKEAVKADSDPKKRMFLFRQHVYEKSADGDVPDYLNAEFDSICDELEAILSQ